MDISGALADPAVQKPLSADEIATAFSDSLPPHQSKNFGKVVALLEARLQGSSRQSLPEGASDAVQSTQLAAPEGSGDSKLLAGSMATSNPGSSPAGPELGMAASVAVPAPSAVPAAVTATTVGAGVSPARKRRRKPLVTTKTDVTRQGKPRKRPRKQVPTQHTPAVSPDRAPTPTARPAPSHARATLRATPGPPQASPGIAATPVVATPTLDAGASAASLAAATAGTAAGVPATGVADAGAAGTGLNVHVAEESGSRSSIGAERITDFFKRKHPSAGGGVGVVDLAGDNSSGSDRSRGSARSSTSRSRRSAVFKSPSAAPSRASVTPRSASRAEKPPLAPRQLVASASSTSLSGAVGGGTPAMSLAAAVASAARASSPHTTPPQAGAGAGAGAGAPVASAAAAAEAARLQAQVDRLQAQVDGMKAREQALYNELEAQRAQRREAEAQDAEKAKHRATVLEGLFRDVTRRDVAAHRRQLAEDQFRIGRIVTHRTSPNHVLEVWEDGHELREIRRLTTELEAQRAALDKRKRLVSKAVRRANAAAQKQQAAASNGGAASGSMPPPPVPKPRGAAGGREYDLSNLTGLDLIEADELVKTQHSQLKRQEAKLAQDRTAYEAKKALLLRELKRVQDEEQSRFVKRPVLNSRYLLMSLLGKGGFSEVWRAMDLVEVREVAVKIHQLSAHWHDAKKANYIKHATREYAIHKALVHRHVVRMHDVFEIDNNSFATVLDLCNGSDLDRLLKQERTLGEREARSIVVQVLSALRYLHGHRNDSGEAQSQCIIHYDLKPGNILLDGMHGVKVTDFGLSKILDGGGAGSDVTSMELTSQGAGTYWYLPPECFQMGQAPARISPKVDVWSLGVILFEMLFGKRPFGDGQSQDRLLLDKVILRARRVDFPAKPAVSNVTKDFITKCLNPDQAERPNVLQLCEHPFLKAKLKA